MTTDAALRERNRLKSARSRARRKAEDPIGYAEKKRVQQRAYRLAYPEKVRAQRARSNAKWNPIYSAKRKEVRRAFLVENAERIAADKLVEKAASRERVRAYRKAYRRSHSEYLRRIKRAGEKRRAAWVKAGKIWWVLTHPVEVALWVAESERKRKERRRVKRHNRRAKERGGSGRLSPGLRGKLLQLQKGKCVVCKQSLQDDAHLDHIVPLALGGINDDQNIQLLCPRCNQQKHTSHPIEFMQSRGFLL